MRSKNVWIFGSLTLAIFVVAGWTVYGQRSTAPRPVWEYKITGSVSEQQLNELGSQGWELAAATAEGGNFALFLKRAKQP